MKMILILGFAVCFFVGLFNLIKVMCCLPSSASKKVINNVKKQATTKTLNAFMENILMSFAEKAAKILPMNKLREEQLQLTLDDARLPYKAKVFTAKNIISGLGISIVGLPLYFVTPIAGLMMPVMGILYGMRKQLKVTEISRKRRRIIEKEMPQFAQFIAQSLTTTTDIRYMLTTYRINAGKTFGTELDKTIADIKTSSVQNALHNLEIRCGVSSLSEIIRGLQGVNNGDDELITFNLLYNNLHDKEINDTKKEALKRPEKMTVYAILMLSAIVIQVVIILGHIISQYGSVLNL